MTIVEDCHWVFLVESKAFEGFSLVGGFGAQRQAFGKEWLVGAGNELA